MILCIRFLFNLLVISCMFFGVLSNTDSLFGNQSIKNITLSMTPSLFQGSSLYKIGGKVSQTLYGGSGLSEYYSHFPLSTLDFDVNTMVMSYQLNFDLMFPFQKYINPDSKVNMFFAHSITNKVNGKLRDYDWGLEYDRDIQLYGFSDKLDSSLDIYSETDLYLTYYQFGMEFLTPVFYFKNVGYLFAGVGGRFLDLSYVGNGMVQWAYSDYGKQIMGQDRLEINKNVIFYDITYYIPYISCMYMANSLGLNVELKLNFSPYVLIVDADDHILRNKYSKGRVIGNLFEYNVSLTYPVMGGIKLFFYFDNRLVWGYGKQTQTQYLSSSYVLSNQLYSTEIDHKIQYNTNTISLGLIYQF
ncbi:hypothetical protein DID75_03315 [Candidatus Marinamargulisbacteria bacterium SCGC AG-410-N11]|nr:hypothetical protein DID75_03315 [Candidatus Marinamargulisbacteria bacterium SCGC AG-410-N11]